jgi:hypothetical protein
MRSMVSSSHKSIFSVAVLSVILAILLTTPLALLAQRDDDDSLVYPPDSAVFGMSYGDWSAAYWQYVLSVPASTNPQLDTTGAFCGVAQSSGPVFFLSTNVNFNIPVTLTCTVPTSKALWIPITIVECSTVEPPPFNGNNPQELRTCAAAIADPISVNTLKLKVDGVKIPNLRRFRTQSPYYDFIMPVTDNLLGLNGMTSGSSVSDGYFVMLKPLSPGRHVIHFEGAWVSYGVWLSVTYNLTVQ